MITNTNLNNLIELEKLFNYGGKLENLLSDLARGNDVEQIDRNVISSIDHFIKDSRFKLAAMRRKWEDKIKKQQELNSLTRK